MLPLPAPSRMDLDTQGVSPHRPDHHQDTRPISTPDRTAQRPGHALTGPARQHGLTRRPKMAKLES
jgi:hypothetical protein